jgi:transcriptional regulator with XRE-family HTH domain
MFCEQLKELMDEYQWTYLDVASLFEVAESTVIRWVNNIARPHPILATAYIARMKTMIPKITECVGQDKQVTFIRFQAKELWYRCDNGFEFPVPVDDTGDAAFLPIDKSTFFMRWIRKHLMLIEEAKKDSV